MLRVSEVERLRQEIKRRRSAVTNKIARTKRVNGASVAGSEFDPRRDHNAIKRYNGAQLRRYLGELNSFMSRSNQFVAGDRGAPLPRNMVRELERKVNNFKTAGDKHMESIGDVMVTPIGRTVSEFYSDRTKNRRGATVNTPYGATIKSATGITSVKALKEIMAQVDKMNSKSFMPDKIAQGRHNLIKALSMMGRDADIAEVNELTDYQFDVLWFGSPFAEIVFTNYDVHQERIAGTRKERWQDKVISDNAILIPEFLEWASNDIPRNAEDNAKKSRKRRR